MKYAGLLQGRDAIGCAAEAPDEEEVILRRRRRQPARTEETVVR